MLASIFTAGYMASCAPYAEVATRLQDVYDEHLAIRGNQLTMSGGIMEIWINPEKSWTAILYLNDGLVCVMAHGDFNFEPVGEAL